MLAPLLIAGAIAAAPAAPADGTYAGHTTEGHKIRVVVAHGEVSRTMVSITHYVCDPHGIVGPVLVRVRPHAAITRRTVRFEAADAPLFLRMRATFGARRTLTGTVKAHGTIGTGDPCTSPSIRFSAKRR